MLNIFKKLRERLIFPHHKVIDVAECDFNYFLTEMNKEKIEAGDTITLTDPDNNELIFVIRKNKT